jgi:protease-4
MALFVSASVSADPRFRADDGNMWHLVDNPALPAVSGDVLSAGYAQSSQGGQWGQGPQDLELISPLVSFGYTTTPSDSILRLGTSVGPWEGFSLGYRSDNFGSGATAHNFGVLWRPLDLVSSALTVDDAFGPNRLWGAGLALRPLTLVSARDDWLTLTADVSWNSSSFAWERWGGRLSWEGSDLRVWYEPGNGPGLEVTVALGPTETSIKPDRIGEALRLSTKTPSLVDFGPVVLRIKGTGTLASSPTPSFWPFTPSKRWNLPELVALLHRAASDRNVVAVAFEDPPTVQGLAGAQELRAALDRLQKAGKKVYVHADSYNDSLGFQGWIAAADRVALNPTGSLWLTAGGSRRLYLKGFFDKIGVKFVNFAPWETKSANNVLTYSSMPDGERSMLNRYLTDRNDLAVSAMASGRGKRLTQDPQELVAQGPYLIAQDALGKGLVDALESRESFETFINKTHPGATLVDDLPRHRSMSWGPAVTNRTVALVHLSGDIVTGQGQAGRSIGAAAAETLQKLRKDSSIRAVLLRVDSPGGAVTPSDTLAEEVKETVASGKLVVVVMGDLAASGGYYLSAPASRIFAQPATLTGSIGVTAALFTAEKSLDLLGIKADGVDPAPSSSFGDWTRSLPETDSQKWAAMIQSTYQRFLDVVSEGRHIDKAKLEPLARGQIYTGREALALGLVDDLGGQDAARAWLEQKLGGPVEFKEFIPGENNPFGVLLDSFTATLVNSSESPTLRLASTLDQWTAPWAEAVTGVAARGGGPLVWADVSAE